MMQRILLKASVLLFTVLITFAQCASVITGTVDFSQVTEMLTTYLPIMNGQVSFTIALTDGTVLTKQHLSSAGVTAFDDTTTLHVGSGAKWIAMATIMSLVEDGTLSLTDTAGSVYPADAPSEVTSLTLLEMMTHTSGYLQADDWVYDATLTIANSAQGIFKGGSVYASQSEETTTASKSTNSFTHGTEIGFSDIGMQLAGAIAVLKSGKDFNTLFQERIATKLGMTGAVFNAYDGITGTNPAVGDGLTISMKDYANFLLMILNKGLFNGAQVLAETTVDTMLIDYTGTLPVNALMKDVVPFDMSIVSFAIGSWIYESNELSEGIIYTSPGITHGFQNYIDVETGYVMVMFVRTTQQHDRQMTVLSEELRPIIKKIVIESQLVVAFDMRQAATVLLTLALILVFY